jgi:CDP-4-dehydro-6-deoxyglucose reductase
MSYKIIFNEKKDHFFCRDNETVLEAALAAGINIPYSCRQGTCKSCIVKKLSGEIDYVRTELLEKNLENILTCQAYPLTDLVLYLNEKAINMGISVKTLPTRILSIEKRKNTIILELKLPSQESFNFLPGQHLNILLKNNQKRSYSIASKPKENYLELHVKFYKNGLFSDLLLSNAKVGDLIRIEGPFGSFSWELSNKNPTLFVASGTGFAPICSMLKAHLSSFKEQVYFYWIVNEKDDIYSSLPMLWQEEYENFRFFPFIRTENSQPIHETLLKQHLDLRNFDIYLCGSEKMIETTRSALIKNNFQESKISIDKFLPTSSC